ncbi:MAG: hypothetical protein ABSB12_00110 [Candidatus Saccharimonadales bacterium]|jgi:hypothetical protein
MSLPQLKSKANLLINLAGFFAALVVMWFGVFVLHLYDATGSKQHIGAVVLAADWLLIAVYGLTILHITIGQRKTQQYKDLPVAIKATGVFATFLVIFGIFALVATVAFYIWLAIAFSHWTF